jgi:hypothetical protein
LRFDEAIRPDLCSQKMVTASVVFNPSKDGFRLCSREEMMKSHVQLGSQDSDLTTI